MRISKEREFLAKGAAGAAGAGWTRGEPEGDQGVNGELDQVGLVPVSIQYQIHGQS